MAEYNPPQPLWKRVVAGILDTVLAFAVFAVLTAQVTGTLGPCPPAVLARSPGARCFGLGFGGLAIVCALTVGYFAVLGATGGTVFQRLFGVQRARHPSDVREVVKIIMRPDKKRRVLICRREDGRFSFFEEQRLTDLNDEPRWRPYTSFEAVCDSAETAEQTARAAIGWLSLMA
jgi:RDD family protein